jgi:hypothetical protein
MQHAEVIPPTCVFMKVWWDVINWANEYQASVFFQSADVMQITQLHKYQYEQ